MTILHGSYSHSLLSLFMIVVSVGAYFAIFWLFSFLKISTLADQFPEMVSYPTYWANLLFFYMIVFPIDSFFHWITKSKQEKEEMLEEEQRKLNEKKFAKGFDPNKLAPIHRRKYFRFNLTYENRSWLCFLRRGWLGSRNCGQAFKTDNKTDLCLENDKFWWDQLTLYRFSTYHSNL